MCDKSDPGTDEPWLAMGLWVGAEVLLRNWLFAIMHAFSIFVFALFVKLVIIMSNWVNLVQYNQYFADLVLKGVLFLWNDKSFRRKNAYLGASN